MCGLVGLLSDGRADPAMLRRMADSIAHRGPDDEGIWTSEGNVTGFGHRRLSIIDLSAAGHQPMTSACGRYTLAYNGEIYNHLALRAELAEPPQGGWRGHSDTETILAALTRWGVAATLDRLVGMFAIAIWDHGESKLHLIRDRMGEKPLYYGWIGGVLAFASEMKALRVLPGFSGGVDPEALNYYVHRAYVPAPWSIHPQIFKLEPGCHLALDAAALASPPSAPPSAPCSRPGLELRRYWSADRAARAGQASLFADEGAALEALEAQLRESIALQTISDVPLGAFLSGGVDSSLICALLQQELGGSLKTFTIGFDDPAYDESPHALAVARHLGTDHHPMTVTAEEVRAVIPQLPVIYDEPFADSSQIPTHLVARLARSKVTVALSGDAGDELFGGYTRYLSSRRLWNRLGGMPGPLRKAGGHAIGLVPPGLWRLAGRLPMGKRLSLLDVKAAKLARLMRRADSMADVYADLIDIWGADSPVKGGHALGDIAPGGFADPEHDMMLADTLGYLPGDILCKVDRAAMAVSLETRVPFLDHRIVELAWRMPLAMKIRDGLGKLPLRNLLYRHVPRDLIERPKSGFAIPVGEWLKGPLRDWAGDLLHDSVLQAHFDTAPIERRWREHASGRRDWTQSLWTILMFSAWLRTGADQPQSSS
ncbi:MAG: asparagine synthase (glutamine-hydrolyzing) [Blastomonas sp.]